MVIQRQQVAIRKFVKHEQEAQETTLALQRSLDRATLGGKRSVGVERERKTKVSIYLLGSVWRCKKDGRSNKRLSLGREKREG